VIRSSFLSRRALWGFFLAVLTCAPWPSLAASISSVEVLPALPSSTDPITLRAELSYPTSGFSVGSFDTTFLDTTDIRLDIFVDSPAAGDIIIPVISSEIVDAPLGVLPESAYTYTVRLFETPRGTSVFLFQGDEPGSFTVVPEPTTLHLVGAGLLAFLGIRRRPASRCH
jgi:hypothetical protein